MRNDRKEQRTCQYLKRKSKYSRNVTNKRLYYVKRMINFNVKEKSLRAFRKYVYGRLIGELLRVTRSFAFRER